MRRIGLVFPSVLIAAAAVFSSSARATISVPLSVEDLSVRSRAVVRGIVRQRHSAWDEARRRISTFTEVSVTEVIAGQAPATIVVRTIGGEVDGVGMKVSGTPRLLPDQHVVLFLRTDVADADGFTVVGMSQGLYRVEDSSDGPVAVPGVEGMSFVRSGNVLDERSNAVRLPLDTLRARVRAAARMPAPSTPAPAPSAPAPAPSAPAPAPAPVTPQ